MRFLIVESETPEQREARRKHSGNSSGETYQVTLSEMSPGATVERLHAIDDDTPAPGIEALAAFDAIFITGSPMHVYHDTPEVRRALNLMRDIFRSGTPCFGSCAGLQIATAAAGGTVRKMPQRMEAGVARRITATDAGRDHPMLHGRAAAWDAPAIHGDEVATLPPGAICLATNEATRIQAAEIRFAGGVFWGVQYHPELSPDEIAVALRRQSDELVEAGLADDAKDVERHASLLERVGKTPDDPAAGWLLGIGREFADEARRRCELANFIEMARRKRFHTA